MEALTALGVLAALLAGAIWSLVVSARRGAKLEVKVDQQAEEAARRRVAEDLLRRPPLDPDEVDAGLRGRPRP